MSGLASENQPSHKRRVEMVSEWLQYHGIGYGAQFLIEEIERLIMLKRDTFKFARVMMDISSELIRAGYVLSTAETNQKFYRILPQADNAKALERWRRERLNSARRGVTLASSTPRDGLSVEDVKRLERNAEMAATDLILLRHSRQAMELLKTRQLKGRLRE
jgi:hypothetical protein